MPIPKTRQELSELLRELDNANPKVAQLRCVDDWTVKDLLAVRAWWTENVLDWIEAGRRGESPTAPAPGYTWKETPRLNADVVEAAKSEPFRKICARLEKGFARVLATIDALDDTELLQVGVFDWAGNWPIARWISVNTARQYTTARTLIRRALQNATAEN
jgi:hypothetical protein